MFNNLVKLVQKPIVRTLLIAWILFYVINQITYSEFMRNLLGLPVIVWAIYSVIAAVVRAKQARKQLRADIESFSQVSNPDYIDSCRESAIALNYPAKTIYLIDDKKRKAVQYSEILRWEMFYNEEYTINGGVIAGDPGSPAGQAVIGAALGGGILVVISRLLFKRHDIGHVKFWINDTENTIFSVYVSNNKIIEQMQHFSMVNGLKVH